MRESARSRAISEVTAWLEVDDISFLGSTLKEVLLAAAPSRRARTTRAAASNYKSEQRFVDGTEIIDFTGLIWPLL